MLGVVGLSKFDQPSLPLLDLGVVLGRRGEVLLKLLDYRGLWVPGMICGGCVFLDVRMCRMTHLFFDWNLFLLRQVIDLVFFLVLRLVLRSLPV